LNITGQTFDAKKISERTLDAKKKISKRTLKAEIISECTFELEFIGILIFFLFHKFQIIRQF
jgi:hypothetical protein